MPSKLLPLYQAKIKTPFAVLGIATAGNELTRIDYLPLNQPALSPQTKFSEIVCEQIDRYLVNPWFEFTLPISLSGTAHQKQVWKEIEAIRPGNTLAYSDIAKKIGSGPRAVGGACRANPIPLVIPCHRVVARSGLGGFAGANIGAPLEIKRWLLAHEKYS